MAIDFEAEGLLDGLADGAAREARLDLLRALEAEGFSLDELSQATAEGAAGAAAGGARAGGRGAALHAGGDLEMTGLDFDFLAEARRAIGAPAVDPNERVLSEEDLVLARTPPRCSRGLDGEQASSS